MSVQWRVVHSWRLPYTLSRHCMERCPSSSALFASRACHIRCRAGVGDRCLKASRSGYALSRHCMERHCMEHRPSSGAVVREWRLPYTQSRRGRRCMEASSVQWLLWGYCLYISIGTGGKMERIAERWKSMKTIDGNNELCDNHHRSCGPSRGSCGPSRKSCGPSRGSCGSSRKSCGPSRKSCGSSRRVAGLPARVAGLPAEVAGVPARAASSLANR
jgi:hypothetical protein